MFCCQQMTDAIDRNMIVKAEPYQISDGRILNELYTEYFLKSESDTGRSSYLGFNYCPFCGRALSRGLWAAEKKK